KEARVEKRTQPDSPNAGPCTLVVNLRTQAGEVPAALGCNVGLFEVIQPRGEYEDEDEVALNRVALLDDLGVARFDQRQRGSYVVIAAWDEDEFDRWSKDEMAEYGEEFPKSVARVELAEGATSIVLTIQ